jgi:hypothetical protein
MYMDFADFPASKGLALPTIEPLSARVVERLRRLHLFVVYAKKPEESGIVHQSLRSLYEAHAHVRESMDKLALLPLLLKEGAFLRFRFVCFVSCLFFPFLTSVML